MSRENFFYHIGKKGDDDFQKLKKEWNLLHCIWFSLFLGRAGCEGHKRILPCPPGKGNVNFEVKVTMPCEEAFLLASTLCSAFLGEVIEIQSTQTLLIILFFCPYRSIDNVVVKESMLDKITRDFSNLKKKSSINKGII